MTDRTAPADPAVLLAHVGWLRALARQLLDGSDGADDVVQTTFVTALEKPPQSDVPLGPWLARVARNAALQLVRARGRRRRHETVSVELRAAREAAMDGPEDAAERAEAFRILVAAVLALDPPYRDVILAVYFDGLSTAQAAERLGVPTETARTRRKRAIGLLRRRLRDRQDDHRKWLGLIVASSADVLEVGSRRPWSAAAVTGVATVGGLLMKKSVGALLVGVAVVATFLIWDPEPPQVKRGTANDSAVAENVVDSDERAREGEPLAAEPTVPRPRPPMTIRVVDGETGLPISRALVFIDGDQVQSFARTSAGGAVRWGVAPNVPIRVRAVAEGFESRQVDLADPSSGASIRLWKQPLSTSSRQVVGVVLDPDGDPVAGVPIVGSGGHQLFLTESDEEGRFRLSAPWMTFGMVLSAEHAELGSGTAVVVWRMEMSGWEIAPEIELQLGASHELPVRVRDPLGQRKEGPHVLRIRRSSDQPPRLPTRGATVLSDREVVVENDDTVRLAAGVWELGLYAQTDGTLLDARKRVVVDERGVWGELWLKPGARHHYPGSAPLEELAFTTHDEALSIRVVAAADSERPVGGATVVVQSKAEADPHGHIYTEYGDERALRPSGINASIGRPRRAEPYRRRTVVTDSQGRVQVRGWIPWPVVITVEGELLVPTYRVLDAPATDAREVVLEVERGARLSVTLPSRLKSCVLERVDVPELHHLDRQRNSVIVPAGTYRVRRMRPPGHSTDSVVLEPPFELRSGASETVDLADVVPQVTDVLVLQRAAARHDVFANSVWLPDPVTPRRPLVAGEARFDVVATVGPRRYHLRWTNPSGSHLHEVQFAGDEPPGGTRELRHSLDYVSGELELSITGLEAGTHLLLSTQDLDAPHARSHQIRIPAAVAARGAVRVSDLPAGEYSVHVLGVTRRTVSKQKIRVDASVVRQESVLVEDLRLDVVVEGYESPDSGFPIAPIVLQPVDDDGPRSALRAESWRAPHAAFRRVPRGRYRLRVMGSELVPHGKGRASISSRILFERTVTVDESTQRIDLKMPR